MAIPRIAIHISCRAGLTIGSLARDVAAQAMIARPSDWRTILPQMPCALPPMIRHRNR